MSHKVIASPTAVRYKIGLVLFPQRWRHVFVLDLVLLLSPSCGQRPWSGDYKTPSVRACVCLSVRPSIHFCINHNISFIYKDIFTKFAGNVYGYENLSLQKFSLILKNKMAAIANCLKIIKVL